MKKIIKLTALILALFTFVFLFSGCKALDDARAKQAFWLDKEHSKIKLGERTYKLLPENPNFSPSRHYDYNYKVTEKDVPVLITYVSTNTYASLSKDKELINANTEFFAREDVYGKYVKLFSEYKLDSFSVEVSVLDGREYFTEYRLLTDGESELLNTALASLTPAQRAIEEYCDGALTVYSSDKSLMFNSYQFDVFNYSGKVIIEKDGQSYTVPDDLTAQMIALVNKYRMK